MDAYRGDFPYPLASLKGHKACVFGKVGRYRGKPAMMLFRPEQIATEKTEFINTSR
jgi:hypothetical protein